MTNLLSIIISLVVLLLIIFIKDIQSKKNYNRYHGIQYYKLKNYNRVLIVISILIFIFATAVDIYQNKYDHNWLSFITIVLNALSIATITLPISLSNIYNIKESEHKYIYAKYIVTDIYNNKLIKEFNRAGIKVIVLTKKKFHTNIKRVEEDEFNRKMLTSNLIINTNDKEFITKLDNAIYEFKDLNNLYHKIENSRGKIDNIARSIKYNILTYLPLILLYFVLIITGYPVYYNILLILFIKLITVIATEFVYKKMPYDNDLMKRRVVIEGKMISGQEILFIIFTAICTTFCYSFPYQFIIYQQGTMALAVTIALSTLLFSNIFIIYCLYSESALLKNIIKAFKSIRVVILVLSLIIISVLINFVHILGTKNIGIHNYLVTIIFGFLPLLIIEVVKLARYTTTKGVKKREIKNNQKHWWG